MQTGTLNPGWFDTLKLNIRIPSLLDQLVPAGMSLIVYDTDSEAIVDKTK